MILHAISTAKLRRKEHDLLELAWYQSFLLINLMFSKGENYFMVIICTLALQKTQLRDGGYDIISKIKKFIVIIRSKLKLFLVTTHLKQLKQIKPKPDSSNGTKNYQSIALIRQISQLQQNSMAGKKGIKFTYRPSKKGIYNKYSFQERRKLIFMVIEESRTLASSAKILGICQTTARLIVSTWKSEGRVFEKKSEKDKRIKKEKKKEDKEKRREKALRERQQRDQGELLEGATNSLSALKLQDNCPVYPASSSSSEIQSSTGNAQIHLPLFFSPFEQYPSFNNGQYYCYPLFPFPTLPPPQ